MHTNQPFSKINVMGTLMDHGALLDFTHLLSDLAEPPVETHTLTSWEIFPRKKGTSKTLASLKSSIIFGFPFTLLQKKLDVVKLIPRYGACHFLKSFFRGWKVGEDHHHLDIY